MYYALYVTGVYILGKMKYEYKIADYLTPLGPIELNNYGEEGWELINMIYYEKYTNVTLDSEISTPHFHYCFKRIKNES